MNYYLDAWKKIFDYKSRSTRKDFWMFYAVDLTISAALLLSSIILFYIVGAEQIAGYLSLAYLAYLLVGIPTQLALWIRRFHDVGRSGWFYFMILIPIFGIAFLAYNACLGSQFGENKYGPNPYGLNGPMDKFFEPAVEGSGETVVSTGNTTVTTTVTSTVNTAIESTESTNE